MYFYIVFSFFFQFNKTLAPSSGRGEGIRMLKCLHFICNLGSRRLWVWQGRGAGSGRRTSPGKEEPSLGQAPSITKHLAFDGLGGVVSRRRLTSTLRLPLFRCLFMTLFCSCRACSALALRHSLWIRISQVAPAAGKASLTHTASRAAQSPSWAGRVACLRWLLGGGGGAPRAGATGEE